MNENDEYYSVHSVSITKGKECRPEIPNMDCKNCIIWVQRICFIQRVCIVSCINCVCLTLPLTLFILHIAVAVGVSQTVFLQVFPDAKLGPLHPPLTFQLRLVHRVRHCENALPVALGNAAAAVGWGGDVGGGSFNLGLKRQNSIN